MLRHIAPVVLVVTLATVPVRAQSISTIAGGGSDDGRPATSVGLFGVRGLALDRSGGLLITEQSNNTIRRVDLATGAITTLAGNGGGGFAGDGGLATFATLREPRSVAVDATGNVYIADGGNGQGGRVRRINAQTGVITTVAGGAVIIDRNGLRGSGQNALVGTAQCLRIDSGLLIGDVILDRRVVRVSDAALRRRARPVDRPGTWKPVDRSSERNERTLGRREPSSVRGGEPQSADRRQRRYAWRETAGDTR